MSVTPPSPSARPLRVALLGLGTVGSAVAARLLDEAWRTDRTSRGLPPPELVVVGVREPSRRRAVDLPASITRTDDLAAVVERDDVDVVVELLGGLQPAGSIIVSTLDWGKAVVTANKALLAELGPALESAARHTGAALRFEAAVAAGIPILAPLTRDLAANRIESVRGIVNGTTNYILSAMHDGAGDYDSVLADAQAHGYAEADPAGDVEGRDAAHKLVLLARLAFGTWIGPSGVRRAPHTVTSSGRPGITGVTGSEVAGAKSAGMAIKLIAWVARPAGEMGGRLIGSVEPMAVPRASVLGSTDGVTNAVEVTGRPVGRLLFQGPGAGGDATSSAVLADLLALSRGEGATWGPLPAAPPAAELDDGSTLPTRWFGLLPDGPHVTAAMPLAAARAEARARAATHDTTLYRVLEEAT